MFASPVRTRGSALLALALSSTCAAACGVVSVDTSGTTTSGTTSGGGQSGSSTSDSTGGSGGATASSGSGGFISGVGGGPGGGPMDCARLEGGASTVDHEGTPAQAYCDGTAVNPPECPATKPEPSSACSPKGIRCAYPLDSAVATYGCNGNGTWNSGVSHCFATCDPALPEDAVASAPACGSLPDMPCDGNAGLTDLERATWLLDGVAQCCNPSPESSISVVLENGCATSVHVDASGSDLGFGDCFRTLIAGRRFSCATGLSCLQAVWSTLQ
jgi:hypothetical protein